MKKENKYDLSITRHFTTLYLGRESYIPEWLQIQPQHTHYAEWWLGAHPSPSILAFNGKPIALNQYLETHPTALGDASVQTFGCELPYLLKILDVEKLLSIQLHPTKKQAETGFGGRKCRRNSVNRSEADL